MCRNQCCEVFVGVSLFLLMLATAATPWYFTSQSLPEINDDCAGVQLWGWNRLYFYASDGHDNLDCKLFFETLSKNEDHVNWRHQCDDGLSNLPNSSKPECDELRKTFDGTLAMVLLSLLCSFLSMCGSFAHCCSQYNYSAKGTVHKVITWIGFVTMTLALVVFGARMPKSNYQLLDALTSVGFGCKSGSQPDGSLCVPNKFWGDYHGSTGVPGGDGNDARIDVVYGPAGFVVGLITALWYTLALCIAHRGGDASKQPLAVQQHVTKIYSGYPQQAPAQQQQPQYYAAQPVQVDNTMMPNNGGGNMYTGGTGV